MNSYIKRIKKYKIKLTHNSSKKSNVVLIPTSLDDQYDINTINKLEQNLNEKHQITILYPNIKNYCSIEALIEKDTNIKEGDAICFMGHGSETMGIEVILNSPQKKYLNFDNLLSIIQNSKGKDLTLILLACDLVYYDKFRNKFMASGLNNRVNFIYSSSSFSFWKMEIFMAGFCRGLELGMSYFNCYQYGKDFIDFRGLLGYKLQFEPLQVDKENILHN
jgi:hypothetical protein